MLKKSVTFPRTDSVKFFKTLNQRVNQYFNEKGIKRTGNAKTMAKNSGDVRSVFVSLFSFIDP